MHMDHERFAADLFGKHAGRVGQPVVAMDDIEIQTMRQHTRYGFVVTDLFEQVIRVATRETYATQIVRTDTAVVITNTIAQVIVLLRTHLAFHPLLDVIIVRVFPNNRYTVGADDTQE